MRTNHGQKDLLAGPQDEQRFGRKREIISGRHAGRSQFAIKIGGNESSPEDLGFSLSRGRFHIQCQKSMKEVISEEGHEQKTLDGAGVVLVDMIGVPFLDQLLEAIVLNIPSLVAQTDDLLDENFGRGKRRHPDPVTALRIVPLVELPAYRVGFQRTNDAHGSMHLWPREQVRKIPPAALARSVATRLRRYVAEQSRHILIQIASFILENDQRVFAMSQEKIEKRRLGVECVGQHQSKGARIGRDHARQ